MNTPHITSPLLVGLMSTLTVTHAATWEAVPPLPESAAGFVAGCVNGKIIVAGGTNWRDGVKRWLDTVWMFDPVTNEWTSGPNLLHPVAYAAFASDGTRLHFAGGTGGKQGRKEIYALDANLQIHPLGELPKPVVFAGGAMHQGRLFIVGGMTDPDDWSTGSNQLFEVNVSEGCATDLDSLKLLQHPLGIPAVIANAAGIHTFTGAWVDEDQAAHNVADAFTYSLASKSWKKIADYPEAIRGVFSVQLDEHRIYLAGGYGTDAEGFVAKAWIYDLRTNHYTPAAPLPLKVNTTFVRCGDFIYLLGGEDQKKHRSAACWRIRIKDLLGEL
jgi:N-acetylneuraminate epimerase